MIIMYAFKKSTLALLKVPLLRKGLGMDLNRAAKS